MEVGVVLPEKEDYLSVAATIYARHLGSSHNISQTSDGAWLPSLLGLFWLGGEQQAVMSSQAGEGPSSSLDGTPAPKLNVTIGVAAFIVIFGCVVFFITLDLCLRYFVGHQIVPTGRSRRRGLIGDAYTNLLNRGLDKAVLDSLPVFVYAKEEGRGAIECVVCLSDFEDKEQGRILPKCSHAFHTACIDMWFQSHVTCPVCRSTVNAPSEQDQPPIAASDSTSEQSPNSSSAGPSSESETAESSPHLAIDIPNAASVKAATDQDFRSPVAATLERLKSLRRLLSSSSRRDSTSEQQQSS